MQIILSLLVSTTANDRAKISNEEGRVYVRLQFKE